MDELKLVKVRNALEQLPCEVLDQVDGEGTVLVLAEEVEEAGTELLEDLRTHTGTSHTRRKAAAVLRV